MRHSPLAVKTVLSLGMLAAALMFLPVEGLAMGGKPQREAAPKQAAAAKQDVNSTPQGAALKIRPEYATSGGRGIVRLAFSEPMVDKTGELIGKALSVEDMPFSVTPDLPGEGRWVDEKSFIFQTYERVPRATAITLTQRGALTSLSGSVADGKSFAFTPFPFVFQAGQTRYAADGTVTLEIAFSATVDFAKLKAALAVADAKKAPLPFELSPLKGKDRVSLVQALIKPETLDEVTLSLPQGFLSEEGPVGLAAKDTTVKVKTTSMLTINTVRPRQSSSPPWERYIEVRTTNAADVDAIRQYLDITPDTKIDIVARSDGFRITGDFMTRPRINLTFKKGMPGLTGILAEDFSTTVAFNDFTPNMAFDAPGRILSPGHSMRVPLSSINVEKVQATLWQLPESNIPLMASGFFDAYKKHLSRKIAVREGVISAARNTPAESSIDLTQIAGKAKGVFLLTLFDATNPKKKHDDEAGSPYGDDYNAYVYEDGIASPIEKLVVISDIGITARVMPDSVTVWANSITTAEAVRNARVRVFAANNVLLAEGRTDKDGLWRHARKEPWAHRERPVLVTVSTTADHAETKPEKDLAEASLTDIAFLRFDADLGADSAFDTGGRDYVSKGYEAYCFTPRGVFRPGETVDVKILVRDAMMRVPEQFPVAWRVKASTGRVASSGTAMLSVDGGANVSLPLVPSAPTGGYTMTVSLPGRAETPLGYCRFSVEEFQPPRIEVALKPEKSFTTGEEAITVALDASYLFGAPVADAPWEADIAVYARNFSHPDWRSFIFPSGFAQSPPPVQPKSGSLDTDGKATLTLAPDKGWTAPSVAVTATVRVREDGGRWVARNITVPHYAAPFLMGYEPPKQEGLAGAPFSLRVAAVTPEGKAAPLAKATAEITRRETYYARSDRGYAQSVRYAPVATVPVTLENGVGVITFTPSQRGEYRVTLFDDAKSTSMHADINVLSGVAGTDDGASPLIDRVMLSWERPRYQVGETAALTVRAPFPGKLLLTLEAEKEIFRMVLPLKETETTVHVPVLSSMTPNAYCSAWVIRPVRDGETWGAHRAYGVIPLLLDRSQAKLNVALTAPDTALPQTELPVALTVTDAFGQPVRGEVTLALVDEGLLSLTNHATPDPFAFFTAKRAMRGMAYDVYDDLMPFSTRAPLTLTPGGGMLASEASRLAPMTRKLELLSVFLATVATDGDGHARTTLSLPEYSGKGRLMAVATAKNGVGGAARGVTIARDVTVEATVPRMVAPGDTFSVPLVAFAGADNAVTAEINVETEGPLAIEGQTRFSVSLDAATPKAELPLSLKALESGGKAAVRVITRINGAAAPFEQRLEIPVRPPYPRLTRTGSGVVKGGEKASIDIGGGFFPGTQSVTLAFADTPGIGLMRALDYLDSYPYGCLEQTTSAAWPYLAVPAMLKSMDPEKAGDTEFKQGQEYAVRRILSMQRADGGFNGWPGISASPSYAWVSAYAAHFLTEAKASGVVPQDALSAALGWLRSYLTSPLPEENTAVMDTLSVKAYICYVLALNGDAPLGWMQFLRDQGTFLTQSARIFLAGAYATATGKTDALRELGTLPFPKTPRYGWSLESAPRNEALRLLMWASTDAFAPESALLARRVIDEGNADRWRSTQENAMAVMAIGRYIEKTAGTGQEFGAELGAGDNAFAAFTNKNAPTFALKDLPTTGDGAPAPLTLSASGDGTAYYAWTTSGVPITPPAPFAEGVSVIRRWTMPDGTVYDFIPGNDGALPGNLRAVAIPHGTKVTVTLYVKPEADLNSLVLADITPGGFEIDNPNLTPGGVFPAQGGALLNPATNKPDPPAGFKKAVSLNTHHGVRTEMRDDRLLLFADFMPAQPAAYTYTLRAVSRGAFTLPPVSAEDMYDPSIRALSPTASVTVK